MMKRAISHRVGGCQINVAPWGTRAAPWYWSVTRLSKQTMHERQVSGQSKTKHAALAKAKRALRSCVRSR